MWMMVRGRRYSGRGARLIYPRGLEIDARVDLLMGPAQDGGRAGEVMAATASVADGLVREPAATIRPCNWTRAPTKLSLRVKESCAVPPTWG